MLAVSTQPPMAEIRNEFVRVRFDLAKGAWGLSEVDGGGRLDGSVPAVRLSQGEVTAAQATSRKAQSERGRDALGACARLVVTHAGIPGLDALVWTATLRPRSRYAVLQVAVRLPDDAGGQRVNGEMGQRAVAAATDAAAGASAVAGEAAGTAGSVGAVGEAEAVRGIEILNAAGGEGVRFGAAPAGWMLFTDTGGQGGTGVAPFFAKEQAEHASPATLAVYDAAGGETLLLGWLSWVAGNPSLRLAGSRAAGLAAVRAGCAYHPGAGSPAREVASEPLFVGFPGDPLAALEEYAGEVRERNHPPIRPDTVSGWLSWYCSRLKMTEEFVLGNARVIAECFRAYGVETMQVDHGWEHRDIVGHWVANDRFPHGMPWLGEQLEGMGVKLGIWMAASRVSEFAPFFAEHPEAVIHKADGGPWAFIEHWTWAPHGKVYNLDPTHPLAQAHLRRSLRGLMDAGCRYYKVDFIGSAGVTDGVFHDAGRARGNPMTRLEMQQIRDAIGPESWLRYCSSPSNVYCGIVNIGGATMDIGNAGGNWEHLRKYHQQLGSFWYKHRTFWHNEPDALIVGEGGENEARMRCAWLVMSGGVVALGDDLTKIAPERMALIPLCLPAYDVAARPLDLFEQIPSRVWDLHVAQAENDTHVLALFNLDEEAREIAVPLERLGLAGVPCAGWEFWTRSAVPVGDAEVCVTVPARDCRIVAVRRLSDRPQVVGTDMHLAMGAVDLAAVKWDGRRRVLSGIGRRAPGAKGRVFVRVPEGWRCTAGAVEVSAGVVSVPLQFAGSEAAWEVRFTRVRGCGEEGCRRSRAKEGCEGLAPHGGDVTLQRQSRSAPGDTGTPCARL